MDGEEGGGLRLSKRFTDKDGGEVDYKTKAGTAWSHSFLNQKPWHPLSYPNQRRKWIAEQTHAQRERRAEEVSREYAQEQEFFRQAALVSQKEKEKMEMMRAVSFMYVRPPGYDPESAKAAELASDKLNQEQEDVGSSMPGSTEAGPTEDKKKPRPKDVFGRALPTEEQFEALKNAPRLETGVAGRSKPFGIEIRNVKCLRCGTFGHQSGDRECPMKDAVMPSEQDRLKRDDPLSAIQAQTDLNEPLKWELKHKPGLSPPRGGFRADDPNQQIVADEDIFDEYGGFLEGGGIPALLTNFYSSSPKKKSSHKKKHRKKSLPSSAIVHDPEKGSSSSDDDTGNDRNSKNKRGKYSARKNVSSSSSEKSDTEKQYDAKDSKSSSGRDRGSRSKHRRHDDKRLSRLSESSLKEPRDCGPSSSKERERMYSDKRRHKRKSRKLSESSQSESDYSDRERKSSRRESHRRKSRKASYAGQSDRHQKRSSRYKYSHRSVSENSDSGEPVRKKNYR